MRRSNSSGWPVSSACTGASKPSVCADFGTSCTWPSVIMMTPASRSGGVLASALLRSAKRLVPAAASPVGLRGGDPAHLQVGDAAELALELAADGGGLLGPAGDGLARALVDDDDGDVGEALALLLPQRRVGEREQQRGERQGAQQRAAAARGTAAAPPARPPAPRPPRTGAPAASARNRSTSSCVMRLTARAVRAAPARAPGRPCSCRSART